MRPAVLGFRPAATRTCDAVKERGPWSELAGESGAAVDEAAADVAAALGVAVEAGGAGLSLRREP